MNLSHELAWAAGFFDGEGWIKIQKRGGDYLGYYLRIGINHVKPEPLYKLQKLFGGNIRYDDKVFGNRKPRHTWTLSTKAAYEALLKLRPYLHNKIEETNIALTFQSTVGAQGSKVPEEIQVYRKELAETLIKLNADS